MPQNLVWWGNHECIHYENGLQCLIKAWWQNLVQVYLTTNTISSNFAFIVWVVDLRALKHNVISKAVNIHLQEPSQNCSSNGYHPAKETANGMYYRDRDHDLIYNHFPSWHKTIESRLSTMGTDSTSNTNTAWSSGEHSLPLNHTLFDCSNITCQQGFYCEEQSSSVTCSPNCYTWTQFPRSVSIAIDFGILLAECTGVISGVALFIIAGMRWRKVYDTMYACHAL